MRKFSTARPAPEAATALAGLDRAGATNDRKRLVLRRLTISTVVLSGIFAAGGAPVASADHVHPHVHYVVTPNGGEHRVGPPVCENPNAHPGHDQFHTHVHRGQPPAAFADNPVGFKTVFPCP